MASHLHSNMSIDYPSEILMIAFEAIADCCEQRILGNLSEHTLKGVAVEALLTNGAAIMEGTSKNGMGKVVRLVDRKLTAEFVPRRTQKSVVDPEKGASPDIRVCEPFEFVLELQARSKFGSQDATSTPPIIDDLLRICHDGADAFILASDRSIYDSIRGIRTHAAGRPLKEPGALEKIFPESDQLEADGYGDRDEYFQGMLLGTFAKMVRSPTGEQRIIVGAMRNRAELVVSE